jgi:hypothetical protein
MPQHVGIAVTSANLEKGVIRPVPLRNDLLDRVLSFV